MDINLGSDFLNFIIRQGYQPGDRLPSIQELTADTHLDMSANKVREQLEVARQMGWVEVRSKRGTRIKDYAFTPAVRLSALYAMACGERFEDFASLRNHVESAYWQEACALLTDEDLAVMQQLHRQRQSKAGFAADTYSQSGTSLVSFDGLQESGKHLCTSASSRPTGTSMKKSASIAIWITAICARSGIIIRGYWS